jgi:uncharacterized damage-inducible protein DinB
MNDVGSAFIEYARHHLTREYFPKIQRCVEQLPDEDIWWRVHETDNSIGNLILHLSGNIRQWIISGLGGAENVRNRPQEFAERMKIPKGDLLRLFAETIHEADAVLGTFDTEKLLEVRHFQKWDHSCLYAIAHVVEHVAEHMGQIIYITKLRSGSDMKFYNL